MIFRTEDLPAGDRFPAWLEVARSEVVPTIISSEDADDFRAEARLLPFGITQLTQIATPSFRSRRPPALIRRSDPELLHFAICRRGAALTHGNPVLPGGLFLCDTSHPLDLQMIADRGPAELVVLHVPRAALPRAVHQLDRLIGRPVPDAGLGALLRSYLTALLDQDAPLRAAEAARIGSANLDLLTAYLSQLADLPPLAVPDGVLLARIHAYIERHLSRPDLTPTSIAAANHISVRYLHRLFQSEETTVASWIRSRRLQRCHRDLADTALNRYPVHAIGARWGMPNPSEFSRTFRSAYGMPPGEWRRLAQSGAGPLHAARPASSE